MRFVCPIVNAPVVVTDVGETSTLVKHEEAEFAVLANDPLFDDIRSYRLDS